jgi:cell division protein FtsI (penicillin-binding protein 3)
VTPPKRERTIVRRRRVLLAVWLTAGAGVLARATQVQVLQAEQWQQAAERQHRTTREVPAPRGRILDRNGVPLAESREVVRVNIAPAELQDVQEVRGLLRRALGLSAREAARHTDAKKKWSVIPGRYEPSALEALRGLRGVYLESTHQRSYPRGDLARGLLGAVVDGEGLGGVEEAYDEVLRGVAGSQVAARDNHGREIAGQSLLLEPPVPGGDVVLTLDLDLQEIVQETLLAALKNTGARGGDVLVTDPTSGEILALVSARDGKLDGLSAINSPYEPGSTLKPFTVAAILQHQVGRLSDSIDTHGGVWMVGGRPLRDVHSYGTLTLGDALRVSSNVAVAMAAQALGEARQYEALRDFGFGVQAGLPLPGEVAGTLRRPEQWSARSAASLAVGYEIAVTPLQMAMAYGALANGGVLVEPRLLREVRAGDGSVLERYPPRAVRRVVSRDVARQVAGVLVDVVEEGTGTQARMETFHVAGKTGTARAYTPGDGYAGGHIASFGAFFPADDPQLVVFVKLESPKGAYYGGETAAPVTRATMEAALAARRTALDRRALLGSVRAAHRALLPQPGSALPQASAVRFASANLTSPQPIPSPRRARPAAAVTEDRATIPSAPPAEGEVSIPDVTGLPPRLAARKLHAAGLRVSWDGGSTVVGSRPSAGAHAARGATVKLITRSGDRP